MRFDQDFNDWERMLPDSVTRDTMWRLPAYRIGLFLADAAREDVGTLKRNPSFNVLVPQLLRAVDSISANIADGYGRASGRERARYYEIALSSAREARDWYLKARAALTADVSSDRIEALTRILRILTTAIPQERERKSYAPGARR
jgi:four helix bundle protein